MDSYSVSPSEQAPVYPAVELYPPQEVAVQVADVQQYEPYSIAAALHEMWAEAETMDDTQYWQSAYPEREYPSDTQAFRMYMSEVHRELKQSDAVQNLRRTIDSGESATAEMVAAVFRAFERVVQAAAQKLRSKLSPEQIQQLKSSGRTSLDWSYRSLLTERLTQDPEAPTNYSLEDFFLILNPKARKVQYMERQEILKSLRYSMSLGTKERLQHDVSLARQYAHEDMAGEIITDSDLQQFTSSTEQE